MTKKQYEEIIKNKFEQTTLCPQCRQEYMKTVVVHTNDSDLSHASYDMVCKNCGYKTVMRDR